MSTATAPRTPSRVGPSTAGAGALAGTPTLTRFILRRDRIRIPTWVGALTLVSVTTAGSFADLYPTQADRQAAGDTMATPAGLAMSGPDRYLADYNIGSMMGHQMLGFVAVLVALMSVLLIVRHTRTEEETGRAELVRAGVVGRHAHMTAALVVATGANVLLGLLLALGLGGLGLDGVTWSGSLLYGAAHAAVGVFFAGVAAVTVQVTEHSRGASGLALSTVGLAYVLRAAGDVGEGALSWLSPIGWAQRTYVYVDGRWWPLLLSVAVTAALVTAGVVLSTRRDVGAGLRATRPGAASASGALVRPVGLALRLHRGLLIGFAVGLLLLGVSYGSVLAEVEAMVAGVDALEEALEGIGGATIVESFVSMILVFMAVVSSIYGVMATLRPKSEEQSGRGEPLLATALSRTRWAASHLTVALLGVAGVLLVGGLGLGVSGALVLDDPGFAARALGAALAYVPALWVTLAVAFALYGLVPRVAALAWVVPVYGLLVGYLGQILQFPQWTDNLSPFGHVPQLPADDLALAPLVVLAGIAAALLALGFAGLRRRDLDLV